MTKPDPSADAFERRVNQLPDKMKAYPQWCVATLGDLPPDKDGKVRLAKYPLNPRTGKKADVTDPETWGTFQEAVALAQRYRAGRFPNAEIGFVLSHDDPFAGIDLDSYKWKELAKGEPEDVADLIEQNILRTHETIAEKAGTYSELSTSGEGVRLFGYGELDTGRNNSAKALEAYSHSRFMIATGNSFNNAQLNDIQLILDFIEAKSAQTYTADQMRAAWREIQGKGLLEGANDNQIIESITNATNGEQFAMYLNGELGNHGSRSEAAFALMQNIVRYTTDIEQCTRLLMRTPFWKSKYEARARKRNPLHIYEFNKVAAYLLHDREGDAAQRMQEEAEIEQLKLMYSKRQPPASNDRDDAHPPAPPVANEPPPPTLPSNDPIDPKPRGAFPKCVPQDDSYLKRKLRAMLKPFEGSIEDDVFEALVWNISGLATAPLVTADGMGTSPLFVIPSASGGGKSLFTDVTDSFFENTGGLFPPDMKEDGIILKDDMTGGAAIRDAVNNITYSIFMPSEGITVAQGLTKTIGRKVQPTDLAINMVKTIDGKKIHRNARGNTSKEHTTRGTKLVRVGYMLSIQTEFIDELLHLVLVLQGFSGRIHILPLRRRGDHEASIAINPNKIISNVSDVIAHYINCRITAQTPLMNVGTLALDHKVRKEVLRRAPNLKQLNGVKARAGLNALKAAIWHMTARVMPIMIAAESNGNTITDIPYIGSKYGEAEERRAGFVSTDRGYMSYANIIDGQRMGGAVITTADIEGVEFGLTDEDIEAGIRFVVENTLGTYLALQQGGVAGITEQANRYTQIIRALRTHYLSQKRKAKKRTDEEGAPYVVTVQPSQPAKDIYGCEVTKRDVTDILDDMPSDAINKKGSSYIATPRFLQMLDELLVEE